MPPGMPERSPRDSPPVVPEQPGRDGMRWPRDTVGGYPGVQLAPACAGKQVDVTHEAAVAWLARRAEQATIRAKIVRRRRSSSTGRTPPAKGERPANTPAHDEVAPWKSVDAKKRQHISARSCRVIAPCFMTEMPTERRGLGKSSTAERTRQRRVRRTRQPSRRRNHQCNRQEVDPRMHRV